MNSSRAASASNWSCTLGSIRLLRTQLSRLGALAQAPSLLSWVRSNLIDPSEQDPFDADAAREEFIRYAGKTPEEWLAMRSRGELDGSPEHLGLTYRALLLEGPDDLA